MRKLNLGAGENWSKDGWEKLDHSVQNAPWKLRQQAWNLPYPNETFDQVFSSHMLEHISHYRTEMVLCEINRVLKPGGILRMLTPDLRKIAEAYVNNNSRLMHQYIQEDSSGVRVDLGLGQALMGFILADGLDNFLISSDYSEIIGGYGHIYLFDFEMLSNLLVYYGFKIDITNSNSSTSAIEEFKELRDVPYDKDISHSLVIECRKERYIPFIPEKSLLHLGPYPLWMLSSRKWSPVWIAFKCLGHIKVAYWYVKNILFWGGYQYNH